MSDAAHNRTVDGTRTGIEQRVKLECEREQQEQLLLSVIPAYIAAEVSICTKYNLIYCSKVVFVGAGHNTASNTIYRHYLCFAIVTVKCYHL